MTSSKAAMLLVVFVLATSVLAAEEAGGPVKPAAITASAAAAAVHKAGEVVMEGASLGVPDEGKVDYEIGTLYVPENRADPKSRIIGVGFARFKASKPSSAPPIILLPGGPGSSYITGLRGGASHLMKYREAADIILLDQRGFSDRGDVIRYSYKTADEPLDQPASLDREKAEFVKIAKQAVEALTKKGFDLRGYSVKDCAEDVNDLRKALGYEKISIVGVSFGSQWSFAVMRLHPEIVARVVLSGVEPLNNGYDMPSCVLADMKRYWEEAQKDKALQPYIPEGGIEAAARAVFKRLEASPVKVEVKDSKSGQKASVTLGKEDFQRDFVRAAADGPAFILSLYHGHYEAWAESVLAKRRSHPNDVRMIGPLIDTSLGVTPDREKELRSDPACEFTGQWGWETYIATREIWPTEDVGDDFRRPAETNIPVIFLHGDWDVSTPLQNSLDIVKSFPKGKLIIIEHGEHGARQPFASNCPKEWAKVIDFLKTGNMPDLPERVSVPPVKFKVPDFPPPAK